MKIKVSSPRIGGQNNKKKLIIILSSIFGVLVIAFVCILCFTSLLTPKYNITINVYDETNKVSAHGVLCYVDDEYIAKTYSTGIITLEQIKKGSKIDLKYDGFTLSLDSIKVKNDATYDIIATKVMSEEEKLELKRGNLVFVDENGSKIINAKIEAYNNNKLIGSTTNGVLRIVIEENMNLTFTDSTEYFDVESVNLTIDDRQKDIYVNCIYDREMNMTAHYSFYDEDGNRINNSDTGDPRYLFAIYYVEYGTNLVKRNVSSTGLISFIKTAEECKSFDHFSVFIQDLRTGEGYYNLDVAPSTGTVHVTCKKGNLVTGKYSYNDSYLYNDKFIVYSDSSSNFWFVIGNEDKVEFYSDIEMTSYKISLYDQNNEKVEYVTSSIINGVLK